VADLIDLRSDTVTKPTAAMRAVMAAAEVGDDVYGEDPTVNRLESLAAGMLGAAAGLFVPSGIMANQLWLRVLAQPATQVVTEAGSHICNYEDGASAVLAGVQFRTLDAARGLLDPVQVVAAIHPPADAAQYHMIPTTLLSIEQTHLRGGGVVYPWDRLSALSAGARAAGVRVHVDGARLWNAVVASGDDPTGYGALVDGLSFCVSKALGAPVGSVMVGSVAAIEEARLWRRRYGGAMRQVGVLAAAGIHALEHHIARLADDHANARALATAIADARPESVDPSSVETNIVIFGSPDGQAHRLADALRDEDGVLVAVFGPSTLRVVTHLDVDASACRRAGEAIARRLAA